MGAPHMATAISQTRITQQTKEPLFGQFDLRYIREAAARTLLGHDLAGRLDRRLTRAEVQLLAACGAICEIVKGEFGQDGRGEPVGDLVLRDALSFLLPTSRN